jgi:competence protein ComEC
MKQRAALGLLIALTIALFAIPVGAQTGENVTVHFIDVGQGDCILIDTADKDVLIDGGDPPYAQTILQYLDNLGITHLHWVVATHMHEDHIGGLVDVLNSSLPVDQVLVNNHTRTTQVYQRFMASAHLHNVTVAERGQVMFLTETANLTVLNPVQPLEFTDANDNSIVLKMLVGNTTFLFTGDAEKDAENSMLVSSVCSLKSDLLKVGHHGSYTATTQTFLDLVDPDIAIICAGKNNSFGHPHNQTLDKLFAKEIDIYTTIASGTIVVQTDGNTITILNNPEPIPEIPQNMMLTVFVATTMLSATFYSRHKRKL